MRDFFDSERVVYILYSMQKRTLFIGDVHGCYDELMSLLEKIELSDGDELYFVWDLINKWPKSFEVVDFIRNRPNTWSVMGNHEYFLMQDEAPVLLSREQSWVSSAHLKASFLREELEYHREWLLSLPHIIEREDFIVVHGGIHPKYGIETPREVATLVRLVDGTPWYELYNWEKPIIYGHWAVDGLRIRSNTIGLDTGCCFGGHLTAYCLETQEIWQVQSNDVYKEPEHWKNL